MAKKFIEYKDLIGLLLGPLRERPALYMHEATISNLKLFLTGYDLGFHMGTGPDKKILDKYFQNPGFENWFYKKYKVKQTSSWTAPFLAIAKGDEKKALIVFFDLLEEYSNEK